LIASTGTNGHNANPHTTLNSAVGALLLDVVSVDGDISTVTPNNSESLTWDGNTGTLSSNVRGASANKSSTASSENPDWTLSATTYWVIGALTLKPWTPTAVGLESFDARSYNGGTVLAWHTGFEASNLGFRLYRERDGQKVAVDRRLIPGSALSFRGQSLAAGYSYSWWDPEGRAGDRYWLEDVEIGGASRWHGPFEAAAATGPAPRVARSRTLGEASRAARQVLLKSQRGAGLRSSGVTRVLDAGTAGITGAVTARGVRASGFARPVGLVDRSGNTQWQLAGSSSAVKMVVESPGWYQVSWQDLAAAGLSVDEASSQYLQLYANGVQQPLLVDPPAGPLSPTPSGAIEFYGVPDDTPASGSRTYWLIMGEEPGLRVEPASGTQTGPGKVRTVAYTVESRERTVYVPGVLNGERENFFGAAIAADPAVVTMPADHLSDGSGQLQVALQGFTGDPFTVSVDLNGKTVGTMDVNGAQWADKTFTITADDLVGGDNQVTLTRQDDSSIALVDFVRLTYPRTTSAAGEQTFLQFDRGASGERVRIDGLSSQNVKVIDLSDPSRPSVLDAAVTQAASGFTADVTVPQSSGTGGEVPTMLVVNSAQAPVSVALNSPSAWHRSTHAADMVIIANHELLGAAEPLRAFHESEGLKVAVVDVQDIFDEFSYGSKSPRAIRDFLMHAHSTWSTAPRYVLLLGDASYDPRDYLGYGEDLVPTKLVDAEKFETASDDWFADFDGDGVPEMAVGRIPVDTAEEAVAAVQKIADHEASQGALTSTLMVADNAKGDNFAAMNQRIEEHLPAGTSVENVNVDDVGDAAAHTLVMDALNGGAQVVNYSGHGTVDRWRGAVLTTADVAQLHNQDSLPVFTMMNCLNGAFQEPLLESLGEALIRAPEGGAAAVWASTGTTSSSLQEELVSAFYSELRNDPTLSLGDAARRAKAAVNDSNVRKTWVFLGDPAMRIEGAQ